MEARRVMTAKEVLVKALMRVTKNLTRTSTVLEIVKTGCQRHRKIIIHLINDPTCRLTD